MFSIYSRFEEQDRGKGQIIEGAVSLLLCLSQLFALTLPSVPAILHGDEPAASLL